VLQLGCRSVAEGLIQNGSKIRQKPQTIAAVNFCKQLQPRVKFSAEKGNVVDFACNKPPTPLLQPVLNLDHGASLNLFKWGSTLLLLSRFKDEK